MAADAADFKKGARLRRRLCRRVASLRSGGDSACGAEGCGIAPWAMNIKSALRDLFSVPYGMIGILVISRYAVPPYPAAPDFLHGKACHAILRSLCSLTNRVPLPPHPGDRINRSMLSCRDMAPWLNIHSPTTKWEEGGGASHQRGNLHRPQGGCMVFRRAKPGCPVFAAKGGIKNGAFGAVPPQWARSANQ